VTTETQAPAPVDPFAAADAATSRARHYFGYVQVDAWHAVLVKGTPHGKVVFDPQQHSADQRVTALVITLTPLPRAGRDEYTISRELIAESADWTRIIKPSLDKLGTGLKAIHGKYAQIELVDCGGYVNKAGESKTRTMPRFLAIYPDEVTCQAACDDFYAGARSGGQEQQAAAAPQQAAPANDAERTTAARFLPALYRMAQVGDPAKTVERFLAAIAANSLTARYFQPSSSEVLTIIAADLPK
jgi:hypothetical protein